VSKASQQTLTEATPVTQAYVIDRYSSCGKLLFSFIYLGQWTSESQTMSGFCAILVILPSPAALITSALFVLQSPLERVACEDRTLDVGWLRSSSSLRSSGTASGGEEEAYRGRSRSRRYVQGKPLSGTFCCHVDLTERKPAVHERPDPFASVLRSPPRDAAACMEETEARPQHPRQP
jgi:hypothetical protein